MAVLKHDGLQHIGHDGGVLEIPPLPESNRPGSGRGSGPRDTDRTLHSLRRFVRLTHFVRRRRWTTANGPMPSRALASANTVAKPSGRKAS